MDQLKIDTLKFIELVSNFTGINKTKLNNFLKENSVNNVFENPTALEITKPQLEKIEALKNLKGLYSNLRVAEENKYIINSSVKAGDYFKNYFTGIKDKERFVCSFLNKRNKIISTKVLFEGTVNEAPIYPREIVKAALLNNASSVVVAHNHPGGSTDPTTADIEVTSLVSNALNSVNIKVIDHIIVGGDSFFSFAENNIPLRKEATECKTGRILENTLTKNELQSLCKTVGKMFEQSENPIDLELFNDLNSTIENLKRAQHSEQIEKNKVKEIKPINDKTWDMEV